jgi:hypothetical protein
MQREKGRKISAIGIFTYNMMTIDNQAVEWIDAKDFNLADLARIIGIDWDHNVKARVTLEVVTEPCEICGKLTTGDRVCDECGKMICDECAKTYQEFRYCPVCLDLKKMPQTSLTKYSL